MRRRRRRRQRPLGGWRLTDCRAFTTAATTKPPFDKIIYVSSYKHHIHSASNPPTHTRAHKNTATLLSSLSYEYEYRVNAVCTRAVLWKRRNPNVDKPTGITTGTPFTHKCMNCFLAYVVQVVIGPNLKNFRLLQTTLSRTYLRMRLLQRTK